MPLLMVMMALTLLVSLGTALVIGTMTETAIAAAYRQGIEVFYAADAAVEGAIRDLAVRTDWDEVLSGAEVSAMSDGPPDGTRQIGATVIDLTQATAEIGMLLAARATASAGSARLFAYGPFDNLVSGAATGPPMYVCVWVAELVPEVEEDPAVRLLSVVGRAYGATGGQRTILVTVARPLDAEEPGELQVRSWEEPR